MNMTIVPIVSILGIASTIEGLITAGVLIETKSNCNTPLLPVLKADKEKCRLVHDLRAVNDVVEDMHAEVPNPQTLLTNIPWIQLHLHAAEHLGCVASFVFFP